MKTLHNELLKIALLGTERQAQALTTTSVLQPLLTQLYPQHQVPVGIERERAFLSAVALVQQYQAAGFQAPLFQGELPTPQTEADLPLISNAAQWHLTQILQVKGYSAVLEEWLTHATTQGLRVPNSLIPHLIEYAAHAKELRPLISQVIGKRGQWLAQQNPEWQALITPVSVDSTLDLSVWEEGSQLQRCAYLRQLRAIDPEQARVQLQAVWKQESVATRQEFLPLLKINLTSADEAWLEQLLGERSKAIKWMAAELLGALPDSSFAKRQRQRLQQWLVFNAPHQLEIQLPEDFNPDWARDGIEETPSQGQGKKAGWLEQVLGFVPLKFWSKVWRLSPDAMLALVQRHEWAGTLLKGWQTALLRYPDPLWAKAWLLHSPEPPPKLWSVLSDSETEEVALTLMSSSTAPELGKWVLNLRHAWSEDFSLHVIPHLKALVTKPNPTSYGFAGLFRHAATHLHTASVMAFDQLFAPELHQTEHPFANTLVDTATLLRFRAEMLAALESK